MLVFFMQHILRLLAALFEFVTLFLQCGAVAVRQAAVVPCQRVVDFRDAVLIAGNLFFSRLDFPQAAFRAGFLVCPQT